ncbi:prolyl oligopeptidase family serine peptidase [Niabella sp. CJ426]|uniref:prolyl oligopeptidase family serine peptidase n=1 Tax=Niabella sp. CJ426 TaxID=3393740 RepID=UPI003D032AD4
MKQYSFCLLLLIFLAPTVNAQYPATRVVDSSNTYFGTTVSDPYRWLEEVKNKEVQDWFKKQSDYTNEVLTNAPGRAKIEDELREIDKIVTTKYGNLSKRNNTYFYIKRLPGEKVAKYYSREGDAGKEILLFDPETYIPGKLFEFLAEVSDDGSRVLFNLSEQGSELGDIRVMELKTGKFLPDIIQHSSGGFKDGSNSEIIYGQAKSYDTHDPEVWLNTPCKIHVIGTTPAKDRVMVSRAKNPELGFLPSEFPNFIEFKNCPYVFVSKVSVENYQEIFYAPKADFYKEKINWTPLCTKADEVWNFYVNGKDLFFLTTKGNPLFSLKKTSLVAPDLDVAKVLLAGAGDWKLASVEQAKDFLIVQKSKNGLIDEVVFYDQKTGKQSGLSAPLTGNVTAYPLSPDLNEIAVINLGWNIPLNVYRYNIATQTFDKGPFHMQTPFPNLKNIVFEELEVPSYDGTLVPLSIVYDKTKLKKDGSNICFMQGYGSYGMSAYTPYFSPRSLPLINRGAVLAFSHVRGGGEKGRDWYLAGKKMTKPNTWKDFNACAEYLIKQNYTSAAKFAVSGASAGGILIGRAITERPDLYQCAIPKVGCLNALRMEFSPNGPANIPEFGTVKDPAEFKALLEMDAYQHIKKGEKYPAQLITTGFNDPRVESYIPAKFAAKMQAENGSSYPVLLDVDYKAGHFGGSTVDEQIQQAAKEYAFILWQCKFKE